MPVATKQYAEIVEPGDDALELDAIDEEYGQRSLVLPNVIEKCVLEVLASFCHFECSSLFVFLHGMALRRQR
jgi:hypothetical protein